MMKIESNISKLCRYKNGTVDQMTSTYAPSTSPWTTFTKNMISDSVRRPILVTCMGRARLCRHWKYHSGRWKRLTPNRERLSHISYFASLSLSTNSSWANFVRDCVIKSCESMPVRDNKLHGSRTNNAFSTHVETGLTNQSATSRYIDHKRRPCCGWLCHFGIVAHGDVLLWRRHGISAWKQAEFRKFSYCVCCGLRLWAHLADMYDEKFK